MTLMDSARSSLAKNYLQTNSLVKRFGTVHSFAIDTANRSCSLDFGLVGEPAPIHFSAKYAVDSIEDGIVLRLFDIHSEKPWMDEILNLALEKKGGSFHLPINGFAAKLISLFI